RRKVALLVYLHEHRKLSILEFQSLEVLKGIVQNGVGTPTFFGKQPGIKPVQSEQIILAIFGWSYDSIAAFIKEFKCAGNDFTGKAMAVGYDEAYVVITCFERPGKGILQLLAPVLSPLQFLYIARVIPSVA